MPPAGAHPDEIGDLFEQAGNVLGVNGNILSAASQSYRALVGCDQSGRRPVFLDAGIRQQVPTSLANRKLAIAQHQVIRAGIEFGHRIGRGGSPVDRIACRLEYGSQSQTGRKFPLNQEYTCQSQIRGLAAKTGCSYQFRSALPRLL